MPTMLHHASSTDRYVYPTQQPSQKAFFGQKRACVSQERIVSTTIVTNYSFGEQGIQPNHTPKKFSLVREDLVYHRKG